MARYEMVHTKFWDDPAVGSWGRDARYLFLYLLSSPLSHGLTGVFEVTARQIRNHTGLSAKKQEAAFLEIGERVRRYPGDWVWIVNRSEYACATPDHWKAVRAYMLHVPSALVADYARRYPALPPLPVHYQPPPTPLPPPTPGGHGTGTESYPILSESESVTCTSTPAVPEAGPAQHAPAARDKASGQPPKPYEAEALHLVDLYGELVKPPSLDTSRAQAKLNILGRLKKGGYDFATLERCIRRYAEHCAILSQEAQFRKNAGNFFGREKVFESFVGGDWQPPKPPAKPAGASRRDDRGSEMGDWT